MPAYTSPSYPTKKALKEAVAAGIPVRIDFPGIPGKLNGPEAVCGPRGIHKWYAAVELVDGVITKVR